jgi:hypothetical protein
MRAMPVKSAGQSEHLQRSMPATVSTSAAAERMRRHRQRRRDGLRSFRIELRETEIDALIKAGFLGEQSRDDSNAIIRALYRLFDRVFDSMTRNIART